MHNRINFTRALLLAGLAYGAMAANTALAREQAGSITPAAVAAKDDSVIVVTARRREEALIDVPIAITAFSGEKLARQGALDITAIAATTPNITLSASRATNSTLTA